MSPSTCPSSTPTGLSERATIWKKCFALHNSKSNGTISYLQTLLRLPGIFGFIIAHRLFLTNISESELYRASDPLRKSGPTEILKRRCGQISHFPDISHILHSMTAMSYLVACPRFPSARFQWSVARAGGSGLESLPAFRVGSILFEMDRTKADDPGIIFGRSYRASSFLSCLMLGVRHIRGCRVFFSRLFLYLWKELKCSFQNEALFVCTKYHGYNFWNFLK